MPPCAPVTARHHGGSGRDGHGPGTYADPVKRVLLAVLGGLCLWTAFPGLAWWFAAPVGVALISLATVGGQTPLRKRAGFGLGLLAGLACFLPTIHWTGIFVGSFPWIALSVTESLYVGVMAMLLTVVQRDGRIHPFLVGAAWVLQEMVRGSWPFGGFPWARLAWTTADSPLLPLASWAGAPGQTFVVALLGAWLAVAVHRCRRGSIDLELLPVSGIVAVVLMAVLTPVPTAGDKIDVVGVQGNVPTEGLEFNAQRRAVLDNHAATTRQANRMVRSGEIEKPDLVVWPENSSDIDPTRNADAASIISSVVDEIDVPTIVGAVLEEPDPKISNTSLLYLPEKGIVDRYVKQQPAAFAEYIPYRSFFRKFSDKVDLVRKDFVHGSEVGVFTVPTKHGDRQVSPIICFEVAYDGITRDPIVQGSELLIVPTNNATFGYTAESEQQLGISKVRAVEHGRSVVHVSTVGVSALITPDGTAHQQSELFTRKVLAGKLPLRSELTVADRLGPWPERLLSLLFLGGVAMAVRSRRATTPSDSSLDHRKDA